MIESNGGIEKKVRAFGLHVNTILFFIGHFSQRMNVSGNVNDVCTEHKVWCVVPWYSLPSRLHSYSFSHSFLLIILLQIGVRVLKRSVQHEEILWINLTLSVQFTQNKQEENG